MSLGYLARVGELQSVTVRVLSGNNVGTTILSLVSFFRAPPIFSAPSSVFLLEGVLNSKNLFNKQQKMIKVPIHLEVVYFPDPVGHFVAPYFFYPQNILATIIQISSSSMAGEKKSYY